MDLDFYSLSTDPFSSSPSLRICFPHRSYANTKAYLQNALKQWEGLIMLTGGPGTGKSTLIEDLLAALPEDQFVTSKLSGPHLDSGGLVGTAALSLGLDAVGMEGTLVLPRLERFFVQQDTKGRRPILVIDNAEGLPTSAFHALGQLADLKKGKRPLVELLLAGRDNLRDIMQTHQIESLHGRLVATSHLEPLSASDTRGYVEYRLRAAGWHNNPRISNEAFAAIHTLSQGIPRRINFVASELLAYGSRNQKHELGGSDVKAAAGGPGDARMSQAGEAAESLIDVDDYTSPAGSAAPAPQKARLAEEIPDPMDWSKVPKASAPQEEPESSTKLMREVSPSVEAIATKAASKPSKRRQLSLIGQSGDAAGVTLPLRAGKTVIGRVADCDLMVDDGSTSRYHAEIVVRGDGRVIVRDLGSTNGTWVNGRRIVTQELHANDRVQFGSRTVFALAIP